MYTRLSSPGDEKRAKLTAQELESISSSFDESLHSRLRGLSPASASLPWLSSAVDVLAFAHSAVKSLIYELKLDGGDSLLSWYLDNSLKVLDVCNCISSEIERLCLRHQDLRIAVELLRSEGIPSGEEIHQARELLAGSEGEGGSGSGYVNSAGEIEELIRDLAGSIEIPALREELSPVDGVVCRAVRAVSFVTAFIAGVMASALRSSSVAMVCLCVPEEFPWGDPVGAIESTVIAESGEAKDKKTRSLKELHDVEASARHALEAIEEVVASGGSGENVRRLREAAVGMEKETKATSEGMRRLRDEVKELFLTVMRTRKEMTDVLRLSVWKGPMPQKISNNG